MLDKSTVMFWLKESIFWTKAARSFQMFGLSTALLEVVLVSHVIFETRSLFLCKFCAIL